MTKKKLNALPKFDAADYLDSPEDVAAYLDVAFEDGDPVRIADALGVVTRAKGMTAMASEVGITRKGLYKALSPQGDPKLSTLLGVFKALGLRMTGTPARQATAA